MSFANRVAVSSGFGSGSQGDTMPAKAKFKKGDRTRRMWISREEEILAATLVELVARGWKSDNGFRAGYLQKIEDNIRAEFPTSDIRGTPHVTSKLQAWKKNYNSLRKILARTGVGWNPHGDFKIDCDDEQWEQIVHADKEAKGMRLKSWPFWETWKLIFGQDRAQGTTAEDIADAAERARPQGTFGSECNENDYHPSLDDIPVDQTTPIAEQPGQQEVSSGAERHRTPPLKNGSLKRKSASTDDAFMEFLANLHAETNSRLEGIAARIGYEFDMGKAQSEVFDKLGTVDGLTLAERYELCDILSEKSQRLQIFMGMPASARLGYVKRFI